MPHQPALVDGDRAYSCTYFHQGHTVFLLGLGKHGGGCGCRDENLLCRGHAHVVHHPVEIVDRLAAAYEDLEIAFYGFGCHSYHISLAAVDHVVVGREGLGNCSVNFLLGLVLDRIGVHGNVLQGIDLLPGDAAVRVAPVHPRAGELLAHIVAGKSYHELEYLDVQLVLGILDHSLERAGGLGRIVDTTVAHTVGRHLLVVDDLDVIPLDFCHGQGHLGRAKIRGRYISFCLHIICFLYFKFTTLYSVSGFSGLI